MLKKILVIGAKANIGSTQGGARIGMISGIMHESTSLLLQSSFLPRPETINLEDDNEKLVQIAKEAKGQKIGTIGGIPAFIIKVISYMKASYTDEEFAFFADNLEVIISSGTNYRLYKETFHKLLAKDVFFFDIYVSSEGSLGYQSLHDIEVMEFFDDMVFFEFIKADEFLIKNYSNRYLLDQLESGQRYTILITAGNGTFSYANEDIIDCIDSSIPTFSIIGRTSEELNLCCEKTSRMIIEKAILLLEEELKASPEEFFVTGNYDKEKPHYIWFFENKGLWSTISPQQLAESLDTKLKEVSELYDYARNHTLGQCTVHFIETDVFKEWHGKIKSDPYHQKIPKIISDKNKVESILGHSFSAY